MISTLKSSGKETYGVYSYVLDTPTDLVDLPIDVEVGSTAFVISTKRDYQLNGAGKWIDVTRTATSSGGGTTGGTGVDGNGIDKIELTSSAGLVDIYTIYYTDGTTHTYTVTNGTNGANGTDGKDAFAAAKLAGYPRTEAEFYLDLAAMNTIATELEGLL